MTRHEIQNCTDIEDLKELCLTQRRQLTIISEILQYDLKLKNND